MAIYWGLTEYFIANNCPIKNNVNQKVLISNSGKSNSEVVGVELCIIRFHRRQIARRLSATFREAIVTEN